MPGPAAPPSSILEHPSSVSPSSVEGAGDYTGPAQEIQGHFPISRCPD